MEVYTSREKCVGCGACAAVCPKHCIEIVEDIRGFVFPNIHKELCVKCGKCQSVCLTYDSEEWREDKKKVYSYTNNNIEDLVSSSSGGAFSKMSEYVLQQGGYVCGAVFNEQFCVVHEVSRDKNKIKCMRGSKYVQSRTDDSFPEAKRLLDKGEMVLFTGTPCQVLALKCFLKADYENLISVDVVCSGVPSPLVFREYLKAVAARYGDVKNISFRDKRKGWEPYEVRYETQKKTIQISHYYDLYMQGYLQGLYMRESCKNCSVKDASGYCSDLTMGDFWGLINPDTYNRNGVSALLPHSDKGQKLVEFLGGKEEDYNLFCKSNTMYWKCHSVSDRSSQFYSDMNIYGVITALEKNLDTNSFRILKKQIKDVYYEHKNQMKEIIMRKKTRQF